MAQFPLEVLLRLRKLKEDQAQAALGKATFAVTRAQQELTHSLQVARSHTFSKTGTLQELVAQAQQRESNELQVVRNAETSRLAFEVFQEARKGLQAAKRELAPLEKLKENFQILQQETEIREEQTFLDDLSTQRFSRKKETV